MCRQIEIIYTCSTLCSRPIAWLHAFYLKLIHCTIISPNTHVYPTYSDKIEFVFLLSVVCYCCCPINLLVPFSLFPRRSPAPPCSGSDSAVCLPVSCVSSLQPEPRMLPWLPSWLVFFFSTFSRFCCCCCMSYMPV